MVQGKVTIITGSARGIGFEIGKVFAESGAKVVLSDVNEKAVVEAAERLQREGLHVIGLKADVTREEDIKQLIETAKSTFGQVDIFINNAGFNMFLQLKTSQLKNLSS